MLWVVPSLPSVSCHHLWKGGEAVSLLEPHLGLTLLQVPEQEWHTGPPLCADAKHLVPETTSRLRETETECCNPRAMSATGKNRDESCLCAMACLPRPRLLPKATHPVNRSRKDNSGHNTLTSSLQWEMPQDTLGTAWASLKTYSWQCAAPALLFGVEELQQDGWV